MPFGKSTALFWGREAGVEGFDEDGFEELEGGEDFLRRGIRRVWWVLMWRVSCDLSAKQWL